MKAFVKNFMLKITCIHLYVCVEGGGGRGGWWGVKDILQKMQFGLGDDHKRTVGILYIKVGLSAVTWQEMRVQSAPRSLQTKGVKSYSTCTRKFWPVFNNLGKLLSMTTKLTCTLSIHN